MVLLDIIDFVLIFILTYQILVQVRIFSRTREPNVINVLSGSTQKPFLGSHERAIFEPPGLEQTTKALEVGH